jgi:hypothetical protein
MIIPVGGLFMALRRRLKLRMCRMGWVAILAMAASCAASAQYVGKVTEGKKEAPELRSVAVLEYTGDEGNPKASRLVPVAVLDGGALQDGSVYLARPEPMALIPEVEYELEQDGKPVGLFDIKNAGQQDGGWVGFGAWKPLPSAKPKPTAKDLAHVHLDDGDDAQSDEPVLHRKHPADAPAKNGSGSSDAGAPSEPGDPDRPVLRKKADSPDTGSSTTTAPGSGSGNGPVLHKSDSASSGDSTQASSDPDRPVMKKSKKSEPAPTASDEDTVAASDPDRPRLMRGKSTGDAIEVAPSLKGFPPDVQQVVAVSDARTRPPHPWLYSWSNLDDEAKMKSAMEDIARTALGLNPPAAKPAAKRTATTTTRKAAKPAPTAPVPLDNEQFRVFELAYGSGATLVLSAHTDGPLAQQKFVTLVAQPDLYGNALVLLKNVTDGAHLDQKPRMRLVDAVDALADNRGELLFELRGATQRQFALYRVLRGQAEKLFVTGGGVESDD